MCCCNRGLVEHLGYRKPPLTAGCRYGSSEYCAPVVSCRAEREEEERHARQLAAQIERAGGADGTEDRSQVHAAPTAELQRGEGDAPLAFGRVGRKHSNLKPSAARAAAVQKFDSADADHDRCSNVVEIECCQCCMSAETRLIPGPGHRAWFSICLSQ